MTRLVLLLASGLGFSVLPPNLLAGDPAKLLMPFLGLMMAGVIPAISLTINSLKSGGFSVQRIQKLGDELSKLLNYLQAIFLVALIAALTVITGETVEWGRNFPFSDYTSRIFNFIIGICIAVLTASLPKIRRTFGMLLTLGREIAIDEASSKVRDRMAKIPSAIDRFPTKEKFGELYEARYLQPDPSQEG